jgi:hypothetical protein
MGISTLDAELKCFNGPKMWRTEWFTKNGHYPNPEGQIEIASGNVWSGRLVGTHDYFNSCYDDATQRVVARAGSFYVWFNRVEKFTANSGGFGCLKLGGSCPNDSDNRARYQNLVMVSMQEFTNPDTTTASRQALLPLNFFVESGKSLLVYF